MKYALSTRDTILTHPFSARAALRARLLHDFAADLSKEDIDALVASGDYLGSLATSLDSISQDLEAAGNDVEHVLIEKIINTLLYIDTKYTIARK
jgi:hypothetical protein